MGDTATQMFYPIWVVNEVSSAESAVVHGPCPEAQIVPSLEARKRAELATLISNLLASLYDADIDKAISFVKRTHDAFLRGQGEVSPPIQDPPVVKSRGRPRKGRKNLFKGGKNIA